MDGPSKSLVAATPADRVRSSPKEITPDFGAYYALSPPLSPTTSICLLPADSKSRITDVVPNDRADSALPETKPGIELCYRPPPSRTSTSGCNPSDDRTSRTTGSGAAYRILIGPPETRLRYVNDGGGLPSTNYPDLAASNKIICVILSVHYSPPRALLRTQLLVDPRGCSAPSNSLASPADFDRACDAPSSRPGKPSGGCFRKVPEGCTSPGSVDRKLESPVPCGLVLL